MDLRHFLTAAAILSCTVWLIADEQQPERPLEARPASDITEARSRASMLHEMVSGCLQIMHRDFFDEENSHAIPSASLEDVFDEMENSYNVKMKWLTVNADVVNVDHEAKTPFERVAVESLADGRPFVEAISAEKYQFAGPIRLGSQCLKCHVKRRTSTEDRTAGLVITMPITSERVPQR